MFGAASGRMLWQGCAPLAGVIARDETGRRCVRLFGRLGGRVRPLGPQPSPDGDRPDPVLGMLTVDEAAWLVMLVRGAFAEQGHETTPDGAGALRGDGQSYGLHNLAAYVAGVHRRAWPDVARRHVQDMLAADRTPQPTSLDEVRDQVLLKLRPVADLPAGPPDYALEVLPGIVAVAAIDYPTHVSELLDAERLDPLGGWAQVRPVALENLRRLSLPPVEELLADDSAPDSAVQLLIADDFFGAARLCVLEHVLASMLGVERPQHGVLVAVPNRHVLALHVPTGPGVVPALHLMAALAAEECATSPGPISPYVYLLPSAGPPAQLSRDGEDGEVVLEPSGPFAELLIALGLIDDDDLGVD